MYKVYNKILQIFNLGDWNKYIIESNIIIINLDELSPDEFEFIVKILTYSEFKKNKTIIVITNLMTWSRSKNQCEL